MFLSGLVLGLTGGFFIWQQYHLQLLQLDDYQTHTRTQSQVILKQLFQLQASHLQILGQVLTEHGDVHQYMLHQQSDRLIQAVDAISTELSLGQGVAAVVFHDRQQNVLATWGERRPLSPLIPLAHAAIAQEMPQIRIDCPDICQYQISLPVMDAGHSIGTVTLTCSLEDIILNLRHLTHAEVAVLSGWSHAMNPFTAETKVHLVSGGEAISMLLLAARQGNWQQNYVQIEQTGHRYQVAYLPIPLTAAHQPWLALISDVTEQVQTIELQMRRYLLWGAGALGIAMLLLYFLLHTTMQRIRHVSQLLPLLGEEKFAEVRQIARPTHHLPDEMDALQSLANTLANQLEILKSEALQYAESLAAQASQLEHERDFIAGLLDTAPVLILSYNAAGEIQLANQYAVESSGLAFSTLMGKHFQTLFLNSAQPGYFEAMLDMTAEQVCRDESHIRHANGQYQDIVWFHTRLALGEDEDNLVFLSVGMDISTQKQQAAEIYSLAFYDPLTRLPNRRMLMDRLQHILDTDRPDQNYCALIVIDIDRFKIINDTQGHHVGNWILTEIAKRLQRCVDEINTIVRLGSDEFVVLLESLGNDATQAAIQAKLTGEAIREVVSQPYLWQNNKIHCTSSFGIDLFINGECHVAEDRLKHAEIALHYAKQAGRNTLCFFDPDMQSALEARTLLEADLRTSLPLNQFKLFYQLQVDAEGKPVGAECLLRWIHPQRGLVSPLHFIPLAEETHLILPIGHWVLETACQQIKAWQNNPLTSRLQLAVNVSAHQFHQADFVAQVVQLIENSSIHADRLKIELTESTILDNIVDAIEKMEALRQHGIQFSMDDFGTGYSSLAYLTQLPLAQLKIDQAFVRNLGAKSSDAIIVQTIINMAKNLEIDVIAEGVETLAQRTFLKNAGCLKYQGYLFGKPLPIDEFMVCLKREP